MKKVLKGLLLAAVVIFSLASCTKEAPEKQPLITDDVKLLSFGFYLDDNKGVITKDYLYTNINGKNVTLELPSEIDKSKLVARFTVPTGGKVIVDGVTQVSGLTVNDFTVPKDYIISYNNKNVKITFLVDKAPDAVWTKIAPFTQDQAVDMIMKLNPVTGNPFIAYKVDRVETIDEKLAMVELKNGQWTNLGAANGFTEGRVTNHDFSFDALGNPYVVYADYVAPISQQASVMTYKNSTWSLVGAKGITPFVASYNCISILNGVPFIFNMNNSTGVDKRALAYSTFEASAWTSNLKVPNRPAPGGAPLGTFSYFPVVKVVNNTLFLYVFNAGGTQSFSVYKYAAGQWSTIVEQSIEPGATTSYLSANDMEIDASGNIYINIVDNASGAYKIRVKKYTASSGTWSTMGDLITTSQYSRATDLALSPLGTLYLAYHNDLKQPTVISFDRESKTWTKPQVIDVAESSDIYLDFAQNGVGYAAYLNADRRVIMLKYDTPAN